MSNAHLPQACHLLPVDRRWHMPPRRHGREYDIWDSQGTASRLRRLRRIVTPWGQSLRQLSQLQMPWHGIARAELGLDGGDIYHQICVWNSTTTTGGFAALANRAGFFDAIDVPNCSNIILTLITSSNSVFEFLPCNSDCWIMCFKFFLDHPELTCPRPHSIRLRCNDWKNLPASPSLTTCLQSCRVHKIPAWTSFGWDATTVVGFTRWSSALAKNHPSLSAKCSLGIVVVPHSSKFFFEEQYVHSTLFQSQAFHRLLGGQVQRKTSTGYSLSAIPWNKKNLGASRQQAARLTAPESCLLHAYTVMFLWTHSRNAFRRRCFESNSKGWKIF